MQQHHDPILTCPPFHPSAHSPNANTTNNQTQVARLQRENERLKSIVTSRCPGSMGDILMSCGASKVPPMVADSAGQATALLDQSGFLLVKALQSSQPSFCVTDPQMPDNPIVYASDSFIELTGYTRAQVLGRNCRFLQGPDTDPDTVAKIRKGIEEVRSSYSLFSVFFPPERWRERREEADKEHVIPI